MNAKSILQTNAATTAASGLIMLAARSFLYPLFGLSSPLLFDIIAVAFLGYAAVLALAARQQPIGRGPLMAFTLADGLWVAFSVIVLIAFWSNMTPLGRGLIAATALVVDVFAMLQYRAARLA